MWTLFFLIFLTIVLGLGAWLYFIWAVKSGQYEDTERPKYRMLDDEDEIEKKK
jgi:cbb3-type cytochrome oxidase maturation protein